MIARRSILPSRVRVLTGVVPSCAERGAIHRVAARSMCFAALLLPAPTAAPASPSVAEQRPLVVVGDEPLAAEWMGGDSTSSIAFQVEGGQVLVASADLVRWGAPAPGRASAEVWLVDGSRLVLEEAWLGDPPFVVDGSTATARTSDAGVQAFPAAAVSAVYWNLPSNLRRRFEVRQELQRASVLAGARDCLLLLSGDVVVGDVHDVAAADGEPGAGPVVTIDADLGQLVLPTSRLGGLSFDRPEEDSGTRLTPPGRFLVMLRDGSRLAAARFVERGRGVALTLASGVELLIGDRGAVVGFQAIGPRLAYLSDQEPASFEQQALLGDSWPLAPDASVAGGPLRVRRRLYAKGLGMHAPARAEYEVPVGSARFAAAAALDDSAAGGGSCVFRILVKQSAEGEWREVATTDVLRGGDPPQALSVSLAGEARIALEVGPADRGDELDRACWLDARFELRAE